jgi:hypothetical protein
VPVHDQIENQCDDEEAVTIALPSRRPRTDDAATIPQHPHAALPAACVKGM